MIGCGFFRRVKKQKTITTRAMNQDDADDLSYMKNVFFVGKPRQDDDDDDDVSNGKHFTDFCALCKKDLRRKDCFMYGCLQAFCSPECRSAQIKHDIDHPTRLSGAEFVSSFEIPAPPADRSRRNKRSLEA